MDQYEFIRVANRVYGKGIRQIAREFGHSRRTVRKALAGQPPGYRMNKKRACPVMDPVREVVDRWLKADVEVPRKQRHTAKRIFDRLVSEYGFRGCESTVRHYVRKRKVELGQTRIEAMVPLLPEVAGEAEVDWGEAVVRMGGEMRKVKLFCMRPRLSGKPFVRAYPNETQEMFLDGHLHAFSYYGGVFPLLVYDNLKTAVAKVLKGTRRQEQQQFRLFRAHYTFESRFCNVARGNEKGGVEGLVNYARKNVLVPIPEVADFEELNRLLLAGCERLSERVLGGRETRQTIEALFVEERRHLLALPVEPYQVISLRRAKADKYQTARVEGVRYSVPTAYVGRTVEVSVGCERLTLASDGKVVASHARCFQQGQWVLDPLHYLQVLVRKIGALARARPIASWRGHWPASHERLLANLRERQGEREGGRSFVEVLMLYQDHRAEDVEAVIDLAVDQGIYDGASIRCLFRDLHEQEETVGVLRETHLPEACRTRHDKPNLSQYDALVEAL